MPVKHTISENYGTYFITFTCYNWLSLIDKVNGYDIVYNWFDHLKGKGHFINGYVIMPNHVHVLISFKNTLQSINTIVGNGKRFMAYEIIKRLQENKEDAIVKQLEDGVETARKLKNKQHEVWKLSFDWKECKSPSFINQKLVYMHNNPCSKKWQLSINPVSYIHSSAKYYIQGDQGVYRVTNFMEMEDFNLSDY
ncbi:MAG TPA: transposase [Ferruginibacter sp.]|jgi:REP element-mobilizing transposase RayT|nr:transposase [Ferruginibacter sp.]